MSASSPPSRLAPDRVLSRLIRTAFIALALGAVTTSIPAQSLRGSHRSVARPYRYALAHKLRFVRSSQGVRRAVRQGRFVRLGASPDYELHEVSFPYTTPMTRTFVRRLARQYHHACGERLVVTSALRPRSVQPPNSSPRSVHPTGIAIDLRRPQGRCLTWLRETLLYLERAGVIEATEERHPAHFHVAVYPEPYRRYLANR
jgi:hypothetical protein